MHARIPVASHGTRRFTRAPVVTYGATDGGTPLFQQTWWKVVMAVAVPTAIALSYTRNKSIPWALAHGFVSLPYNIYRGVQYVSK